MKNLIKTSMAILLLVNIVTCKNVESEEIINPPFNVEELKPVIQNLSKNWNIGLKTKDISVFEKLYDENAHYLPNQDDALHGNKAIVEYWKASMDFVSDLKLNMESLEGTKDLLYETGNGTINILNQSGGKDEVKFKYVNVWKKQKDGTYKVVIDIFNEVKK